MYFLSGDALKSISNESQVSKRLESRYDTHRKKKRKTPRRSPRRSQKKSRIVEYDPDISQSDSDLSLGRRFSSIAFRVAAVHIPIYADAELLVKHKFIWVSSLPRISKFLQDLQKISHKLFEACFSYLKNRPDYSSLNANYKKAVDFIRDEGVQSRLNTAYRDFFANVEGESRASKEECKSFNTILMNWVQDNVIALSQEYRLPRTRDLKQFVRIIKNQWGEADDFGRKGSIIRSIKDKIRTGYNYPQEFVDFYTIDPSDTRNVLENIEQVRNSGSLKLPRDIAEDNFVEFAALSVLYKNLLNDPITPDFDSILKDIDKHTAQMYKDVKELEVLKRYMDSYLDRLKNLSGDEDDDHEVYEFGDYEKILDIIKKPYLPESHNMGDIEKAYYDFFKKKYPDYIPPPLLEKFGDVKKKKLPHAASVQSSNETENRKMKKTATYHGVLMQGGPDGPTNTGWKSIDKRYIGEKHYESIIASAKNMLKENPWFSSNWDGGSADAPIRAALDLAIATADGAIYQSKIDSPTYEMLLNKLAGWEYDLMKDTVLNIHSNPKKRKASSQYDKMLKDLRRIK
jgi:hypothetical protein